MEIFDMAFWGDHVALILSLLLLGAFTGLCAGLFGIGGGIIVVPGMIYVLNGFGYSGPYLMHIAIGTSLAAMVPTGLSSVWAHYKRNAIDTELLKIMGPFVIVGACFGAFIAGFISGIHLKMFFAFMVMTLTVLMFLDPAKVFQSGLKMKKYGYAMVGSMVGGVSALIGIGGAILHVPFLSACHMPLRRAVATAAALGLCISVPGVTMFMIGHENIEPHVPYTIGLVYVPAFFALIAGSVISAPIGAWAAHALPVEHLRRVFACFMVLVAVNMLVEAW